MLKTIDIYYQKELEDNVLAELMKLPEEFRPIIFTATEGRKPKKNLVSNYELFEQFKQKNTCGYMLYGNKVWYDISRRTDQLHVIYMYFDKDLIEYNELIKFFKALSDLNIYFSYMCDENEFIHRNRYQIEFKNSTVLTWVGRDLSKYISGLYWITYLSNDILKQHKLNINVFKEKAIDIINCSNGYLIKFFNNPEDWQEYSDKIDNLCYSLDGLFSKKDFANDLPKNPTRIEYRESADRWK